MSRPLALAATAVLISAVAVVALASSGQWVLAAMLFVGTAICVLTFVETQT